MSHKCNLLNLNSFSFNNFKFWSHDWFVSRKNNHEIEILKSIIRQFWSHEKCCDQEIESLLEILTSWKMTKNLISWSKIIWSHEIQRPDHSLLNTLLFELLFIFYFQNLHLWPILEQRTCLVRLGLIIINKNLTYWQLG